MHWDVLRGGGRERIRHGELGEQYEGKPIAEGLENPPPSWQTSSRSYKQAWKSVRSMKTLSTCGTTLLVPL